MNQAPDVGPLPAVAVPTVTQFTLANGLPVATVRRDVAPIVSAAFMFRTGSAMDPAGRSGLASLTAEMLDEGAGARDALGIADELEQLGADLWVGSGRDGSQLSVQAPRESFHQAMAIAADVLARPRLADADWRRVQADRRTGVVQRRDQPEAVINVVSDRVLFGDTHPYGQPIDGLERTIDAVTLDDVRAFHARPLPSGAGDAGRDRRLRRRLAARPAGRDAGGLEPRDRRPRPRRSRPGPQRPRLVIVDRPGAPRASCAWSPRERTGCRPIARGCRC